MLTTEVAEIEVEEVRVRLPLESEEAPKLPALSLLGGPLHEAGRRLGIVRDSKTTGLGIAIGGALWVALTLIGTFTGLAEQMFVLPLLPVHLRLLVVIPLFFLAESMIDPRVQGFAGMLVKTGVLPVTERPAFARLIERVTRFKDSWLPDAVALIAAVALAVSRLRGVRFGADTSSDPALAPFHGTAVEWFHFAIAMTVFRFLVFRWAIRFAMWCWFLWRVSRLRLRLVAIHPDRAAGLASLELVQIQLLPLVSAFSVLLAAVLAAELSVGSVVFSLLYPAAVIAAIAGIVLVVGPLCVFLPPLIACRLSGLGTYMAFAARYVSDFEKKWIGGPSNERLLGTPDIQSLADLSNSVNIVKEMRVIPTSSRLVVAAAIAAVAPMAPLLLFQYSVHDLMLKVVAKLLAG